MLKQRLCYRLEEVPISYRGGTSASHLWSAHQCVSRRLSAVVFCIPRTLLCPNLTSVLQFLRSELQLTCCSGLFWHVYPLLLSSFPLPNLSPLVLFHSAISCSTQPNNTLITYSCETQLLNIPVKSFVLTFFSCFFFLLQGKRLYISRDTLGKD